MPSIDPAAANTAGVVIVGAGQAGLAAAVALREHGYAGAIDLLGEEPTAPYQRPPLSKGYLKGDVDTEALQFRDPGYYADFRIALRCSERVRRIDRQRRQVTLADGSTLAYEWLVLATGARPRRLEKVPGHLLRGIQYLRTISDADLLKARLRPELRVVLVGGGYIGLELAAVCRGFGADVTVVERESRLLSRVGSAGLGAVLATAHRKRGVRLVTGIEPLRFLDDGTGDVQGLELADGQRLDCDLALCGVGAVANDELAREAGIACDHGILVDDRTQTSDPRVLAIGDVAVRPLPQFGLPHARLESIPNALDMGKQCAAAILGLAPPKDEVPWFWSDQFDLKLQVAGLLAGCDESVVRGSPDSERLAIFHLRDGRIRCVEAVNSPLEFMLSRRMIAARTAVPAAQLADPAVNLKTLVG